MQLSLIGNRRTEAVAAAPGRGIQQRDNHPAFEHLEFGAYIRLETAKWNRVIEDSGAKADWPGGLA
ncbi:MAG: hypothetical protein A3G27_00560 [Betaproteobacteria bacterium RIFCSPLOWO2_12_FULL_66_14]|nr:MAG: hypothetical protein A3G27_00560 [Betaproteobacteria bacterium RIFCSPLOWO2_12_FULL_66_14]